MRKKDLNFLTVTALGIALYVVTSMFIPIKLIGNYRLMLGYAVLAIYCYSFGPKSGMLVGGIGQLIYCFVGSSFTGMVGWVLGNVAIGFILGTVFNITKTKDTSAKYLINVIAVIFSCALAFYFIKPFTEAVMFKQKLWVRIVANTPGFCLDALMLLISLPICDFADRYLGRKK